MTESDKKEKRIPMSKAKTCLFQKFAKFCPGNF